MSRKGHTNNPNGRPKGVPNKSTSLAREAIALFIDNNTERLQEWLDLIAADNPKDAFNCVKDLMEYHMPKLQRVESENRIVDESGDDLLAKEDLQILKNLGIKVNESEK